MYVDYDTCDGHDVNDDGEGDDYDDDDDDDDDDDADDDGRNHGDDDTAEIMICCQQQINYVHPANFKDSTTPDLSVRNTCR